MEQTPENRERFIKDLLREKFDRKVTALNTLGRDSNNFVYKVELAPKDAHATANPQLNRIAKPGTAPLPEDVSAVVIRISNPQALINHEVRVENEVAAMTLMRDALSSYSSSLVPEIYDWNSCTPSIKDSPFGYVLQEHKPGTGLDSTFGLGANSEEKTSFEDLPEDNKRDLLAQIAAVFKLIQTYELPATVKGYGGLRFDEAGDIVTGPTALPCGGPFETYPEMHAQMLRFQLEEADRNENIVRGWRGGDLERNSVGLRDRLDKLASTDGIAKIVAQNSVDRPTLVHGDFDIFNMLFDVKSNRLTALLDFDFAHVATPADECFYSMGMLGHILLGPLQEGPEQQWVKCLVQGCEGNIPTTEEERGHVPWRTMEILSQEFGRAGVLRPQDIKGIGELAGVKWFLEAVFPPFFASPRWLSKRTPEQIARIKSSHEAQIQGYLERWGY
ncbi:hypothetical protein LQW54_006758 [Pestalotiopsis sp. IQ-011]